MKDRDLLIIALCGLGWLAATMTRRHRLQSKQLVAIYDEASAAKRLASLAQKDAGMAAYDARATREAMDQSS